jgi:hypothetical protein
MNRAWPVLVLMAASLHAQPVSLSVSQIWTDGANVAAYLYPRGQDGLPAAVPSPTVTAVVGGLTLPASNVIPFKEGVAYLLLADVSKSMRPEQFDELRKAMQQFASGLSPQDRMAILSFGNDVQVTQDFTADVKVLSDKLGELKPSDDQTKLYLALSRALELGQRMDAALPKRRAIVVLTDGKDEGSGLNVEDLLQSIRAARVPVYGLGSSRLKEPEKKQYLDLLRRIAANSGGDYFEVAGSFADSYETIRKSVVGVLLAEFDCSKCPRSGKPETWTFSLKSGERVLAASTEITMQAAASVPAETSVSTPQPTPAPVHPVRRFGPWAGGGLWIIVFIAIIARRRKKKALMLAQQNAAAEMALVPSEPVAPYEPVLENLPVPPPPPPPAPAVPQGLAIKLFVMRGQQKDVVHELQLARPTSFGAGPSCGFSLPKERSLAAQQFELSYGNQRVLIRDLSGNATTTVNGVPIHGSHPLNHGDVIGAGGAEFRLLIGK